MNIQRKNSTHHFRMQSEREQTLVTLLSMVGATKKNEEKGSNNLVPVFCTGKIANI